MLTERVDKGILLFLHKLQDTPINASADYSSHGAVAIAFHPDGVAGTDLANSGPEWLRRTFIDAHKLLQAPKSSNVSFLAAF